MPNSIYVTQPLFGPAVNFLSNPRSQSETSSEWKPTNCIQVDANHTELVIGKQIFHIRPIFLPESRKAGHSLGTLPTAYRAKGGERTGLRSVSQAP